MTPDPSEVKHFIAEANIAHKLVPMKRNATIFKQGDVAAAIFLISNGRVKMMVTSPQGKEAVVAVLGPGDFVGQGCLVGQACYVATAQAMTDGEMVRFDKATLARVLHEKAAFSEMFVKYLLNRMIRVEEDLVDQMFNFSEKRLARALLLLANFGADNKSIKTIAKVSQETLAEMIGTTRPRVNYFMNKFRKLGFVSYNGKLEIHSSLLSVVLNDTTMRPSEDD